MTYRIDVAPAALRQVRRLDPAARRRVQAAIELLAEQPRPTGAKMLRGGEGEWRVRTGDYRIIYEIHEQVLLLLVVAIWRRRDIYSRPLRGPMALNGPRHFASSGPSGRPRP